MSKTETQSEALMLAQGLAEGFCGQFAWLQPAAAELRRLDAENKALRGAVGKAVIAMQLAQSTHGVWLTSDPPQESWKFNRTSDYLRDAIDTAQAAAKIGGAA
jgi:hypothetical protein